MKTNFERLYDALSEELDAAAQAAPASELFASKAIVIINGYLYRLRQQLYEYAFATPEEEIHFFKEVNPKFYALLMYYIKRYSVEPLLLMQDKGFIVKQLTKLKRSVRRTLKVHADLYRYYLSKNTGQDHRLFMREQDDWNVSSDEEQICILEPRVCTVAGYQLAKLQAAEMLLVYIREKSHLLTSTEGSDTAAKESAPMTWIASKAALVELIYALHAYGTFDNPGKEIKRLTNYLSQAFNIRIDNVYKMYEQIRLRKKDRTPFLEALKQSLHTKMDYDDEHAL